MSYCVRSVAAEAAARGVRLEASVDEAVGTVNCAPDRVRRVLLNLLTNALRRTPADGCVAVRVEPVAEELHVAVEDSCGRRPWSTARWWRSESGSGCSA